MKSILIVCVVLAASVSLAQPPRPKFTAQPTNLQFGTTEVGKTKQMNVQFRVDSTADADVDVVCENTKTSHYRIIGLTSFTVTKGSFHNMTVEFEPLTTGLLRDTIRFTHNGDTTSVKASSFVRMSGTGIEKDTFPAITIQPQFAFFGNVNIGDTAERSFLIRNTTDTQRTLIGSVSDPHSPYSFRPATNTNFSLTMNDTQRYYIRFIPKDTGTFIDSVIVTSNADAANNRKVVFISGTGRKVVVDVSPQMTVTPQLLMFQTVSPDTGRNMNITIRNSTNTKLTLTGNVGAPTNASYSIINGGGPFSLDSGQTKTVTVRFVPQVNGPISDSIHITSNSGTNPNRTIYINGTGVGIKPPSDTDRIISVSPTELNFGTLQETSTPLTLGFVIKNNSVGAEMLDGMVETPEAPFSITNGGGAFSLAKGETRDVSVTLDASKEGMYHEHFNVTSNATDTALQSITIHLLAEVTGLGSVKASIGTIPVQYFPNPTNDVLNVHFSAEKSGTVIASLIDGTGKTVVSFPKSSIIIGENSLRYDMSTVSAGVYYLQLVTPSGDCVLRVVRK
jgi:hypothetical protein